MTVIRRGYYLDTFCHEYTISKAGMKRKVNKRRKREICWTMEKSKGKYRLYVVCPNCRKINLIEEAHVTMLYERGTGYLGCVICSYSEGHTFYTLSGFNKTINKMKKLHKIK